MKPKERDFVGGQPAKTRRGALNKEQASPREGWEDAKMRGKLENFRKKNTNKPSLQCMQRANSQQKLFQALLKGSSNSYLYSMNGARLHSYDTAIENSMPWIHRRLIKYLYYEIP